MEGSIEQYLRPPKKEKLPVLIANQLKSLILSKKLALNEKLPSERELADMLKVSRVVVSQALMTLEQSGFIEIRRGSKGGAFIANRPYKPFSDFIKDLFIEGEISIDHVREAREAVECRSIQLAAAKASDEDIEKLRTINRKLLDDIQESLKFLENNMAFHVAIADISGNPLIKGIVQSLLEHHNTFRSKYYPDTDVSHDFIKDTYKRHKRIISAISGRDIELCEKLIAIDVGFHKELERLKGLRIRNL
ncbi:MAG: FadR family transcriptional regulator [Deltaproteobacteria bacterium]|nr:FadR family transcriptional regulator [Deltaproteobacteria bacterium]